MGATNFWANKNIEPKRAYRWVAFIGGMGEWMVKKFSKPSVAISETSLKFLNHTFYYPGRAEWAEVSFTLADPTSPDAAGIMLGKFFRSGYKNPTDISPSYSTISKSKASRALKSVVIKQLGGAAENNADKMDVVETWNFINPWVKDIKFGELDYESEDMVNIDVTMRYDFAEWKGREQGGLTPEAWVNSVDGPMQAP